MIEMNNQTFPLFSTLGLAGQAATGILDIEHALIMLLLLAGLLSIQGERRRYVPWVVLLGIGLALVTPIHVLEPAWPVLYALVLPPLLWQIGTRLARARPSKAWQGWSVWLLTTVLIALGLVVGARMSLPGALLLGILAVSLMWQVREQHTELGVFGQLALALLLAEVDLRQHHVQSFLGTLFSGMGIGLVLGYVGGRVASRLSAGEARNLFCLCLAYFAYLAGVVMGVSGVATAIMAALTIAVYGYNFGLWPTVADLPAPLNRRGIFLLLAGTWLLLGWQGHVSLTTAEIAGVGLGVAAAAVGLLMGRWLIPVRTGPALSLIQALWRKERKVMLLLLGTLLLWPQSLSIELWLVVVALLAALTVVFVSHIVLSAVFDLIEVEMRLPTETDIGDS